MNRTLPLAPSPIRMQRARGRAEIAVTEKSGATRLARLYQQGCAKALLPRSHGGPLEAVLVNTAGGVTGGDRIETLIDAGPGTRLTATTQAAERVYRSVSGAAAIETRLTLGPGARLDWLPQETIVFDGGRLERRLEVDMAADAELAALEWIVLGRAAMGERVANGALSDQWRIRRAGRLVHAEALRAEGDLGRAASGPATLAGARAFATLIVAAPGADVGLDWARAMLSGAPVAAAATARPDLLILRFLAADAAPLRGALIRFLMQFRREPLPRVWSL
jgi:urease accessory protein